MKTLTTLAAGLILSGSAQAHISPSVGLNHQAEHGWLHLILAIPVALLAYLLTRRNGRGNK